MRFLTAAVLLATLLLSPVAASAQTPSPAKATPQKVSVQVTFVTVSTADLDALGINFNLTPLPASPRTFIAFAEGDIVPQRYHLLTSTAARMGNHIIALPPTTVSDNVPAVFTVNTQVPMDAMLLPIDQGHSDFPQLTGSIQLRGEITLIPQIVPGNLVRLDMLSPVGSSQRMRFRTIPSGQQVVINAAVVKAQPATGRGLAEGGNRQNKVSHTTELLIFVTPTIITEAPMFVPPTHFLGAAAGNSFAGTTFGDTFVGNNGDASSGLIGFGMTKPSDIFRSMLWLDSSHWQSRSRKTGTMRKSPIKKASPFPSGVTVIY